MYMVLFTVLDIVGGSLLNNVTQTQKPI